MNVDLFGPAPVQPSPVQLKRRRAAEARGYAAPPGTGPAGETCKTCKHYTIRSFAKDYRKCLLMQAHWTGGAGTDIKARSPACRKFEPDSE